MLFRSARAELQRRSFDTNTISPISTPLPTSHLFRLRCWCAALLKSSELISLRRRIGLWITAWIIATVACAVPRPVILIFTGVFPAGLLYFLLPACAWSNDTTIGLLVFGWLLYAGLTVAGLSQKRASKYFQLYLILCVLLLLNVVGCQVLSHKDWKM